MSGSSESAGAPRLPGRRARAAQIFVRAGAPALLAALLLGSGAAGSSGLLPRVQPRSPERTVVGPNHDPEQVIVKFREGTGIRLRNGRFAGRGDRGQPTEFQRVLHSYAVTPQRFQRIFARSESELEVARQKAQRRSGRELADLNLYYQATLPPGVNIGAFCDALNGLPEIEIAYPASRSGPPPVDLPPTTPDLTAFQGYRDAPPAGVGVPDPALFPGSDGTGTTVVDLEYDWVLDHEDLELDSSVNLDWATIDSRFGTDHGTAVLGVLGARDNGYGVTGIVPGATIRVAPTQTLQFGWNVPRAIDLATAVLGPGDAILIEQQTCVCGRPCDFQTQAGLGPMEWEPAVFDAVATGTALGINVIEVAGNGNVDLDDPNCLGRFDRVVRDSGAIIVGAGSSTSRARLAPSSYGSRVDLQGWGNSVATTGYGALFDPGDVRQRYTSSFSATSSAAPIVAGAVLSVQGAAIGRGLAPLDPRVLREVLVGTGTPQGGPLSTPIGPLPSIPDALAELPSVAEPGFDRPFALNSNAETDSGDDEGPALATDGSANWVAVWSSTDPLGDSNGTDADILVSLSADDGAIWTPPVPLDAGAATDTGEDFDPDLMTDGAGTWVAIWSSNDSLDGSLGADEDLLVARSIDGGATWTAPAPLNANAASDAGNDSQPTLTTDGAGIWVAVWSSDDPLDGSIGLDEDLLVARSTDGGATWTEPAPLNANAASDAGNDSQPTLTTDGAGTWVAVWSSNDPLAGSLGSDEDLLVARSIDGGRTWTDPVGLNANAPTDSGADSSPCLATDGSGTWVATWQSDEPLAGTLGIDSDILVARSGDGGITWTIPQALNTNAPFDSGHDAQPQVISDSAGNWLAVWVSDEPLGQAVGTDTDLLMARSIGSAIAWSTPQTLDIGAGGDAGSDSQPRLATDGAGNWAVAWSSDDDLNGTIGADSDILVSLGSPAACGNEAVENGEECDDGNRVNGDGCDSNCTVTACGNGIVTSGEECDDGNTLSCDGCSTECRLEDGCDDGNPCTADLCDPTLGCENVPQPAGSPCDDESVCTTDDTCDESGACIGGPPPDCSDGNDCTDDFCIGDIGCIHSAHNRSCEDGNFCTTNDMCNGSGGCVSGPPLECDDAVPCTVDGCDEAIGCIHTPDDTPCDDGEFCNGAEVCDPVGGCSPGPLPCTSEKSCDENANVCLEDTDLDGEPDLTDNCFSVPNAGQLDTDADGLGDACDNCRKIPNGGPIAAGHLGTGGQTDDDHDGLGNRCDGDFTEGNGDGFVNVNDLLRMLEAFGKRNGDTSCPDPMGNPTGPCARYDLNVRDSFINVSDLNALLDPALFGKSAANQGCSPADDGLVYCPLP